MSWDTAGDRVSIAVRDDGPGIAPELHVRLFTPFDRLGAESSGIEGTGVGLTVTRGLVEVMKGDITVDSAVGLGSTFRVAFPAAREPIDLVREQVKPATATPVAHNGAASSTVLYIEDNEPNVRVMESLLDLRPSWRLIHAALSRLGVELAKAHRPDLVMLDLHLPDGSGFDVLAAIKKDKTIADTPIVVLSADASPNQVRRLLAAGATRYMTKPLNLDEVLDLLDSVGGANVAVGNDPV